MLTLRTVRVLLLVLVVSAAGACVPVRNLVSDRDLVCEGTPDDVCLRVAEVGITAMDLEEANLTDGPYPTIAVVPSHCRGPNSVRCWAVEVMNERGGFSVLVVQRQDGSLALN